MAKYLGSLVPFLSWLVAIGFVKNRGNIYRDRCYDYLNTYFCQKIGEKMAFLALNKSKL
jgi:hypothetical protein